MEVGVPTCRVDGSFLNLAAASDLLYGPEQLLYVCTARLSICNMDVIVFPTLRGQWESTLTVFVESALSEAGVRWQQSSPILMPLYVQS